ncbi:FAD-dependent oxidoreductase [Ktedonosporobacter rubrisoli]|nr:FAD-dependent oxidoreductase [Ktedonosporobacter rubrisoli]
MARQFSDKEAVTRNEPEDPSNRESGRAFTPLDVLVVGAGPTGLVMASELLRRGISCRLIDQKDGPSTTSRALGMQSRTLELFEQMGIITPILEHALKLWETYVYGPDGKLQMRMNWQALPQVPYPYQLVVAQAHSESVLREYLKEQGGQVEWQRELVELSQDEQEVTARVKSENGTTFEVIHARYVIGCDGAHSFVRKSQGISFEGSVMEADFWLADAQLKWERPQRHAYVWSHQEGLFSVMPLPFDQQWRLFAHIPRRSEAPEEVTLERFREVFTRRTGELGTVICKATWLSNFHIHQRMVTRYRQGRVFLAGDAAHIHSPTGGQGLNTGIQDAYNLAWKLALVLGKQGKESLLETYESERLPVAQSVLKATGAGTALQYAQHPVVKKVVSPLLSRLIQLPAIQRKIALASSELLINYRPSPLSHGREQRPPSGGKRWQKPVSLRKVQAGDRAPQATFLDASSQTPRTVFQLFQQGVIHLLLFTGLHVRISETVRTTALARLVCAQWHDLIVPHLVFAGKEQPSWLQWSGSLLLDVDHEVHSAYGMQAPALCLLRPDGYIGMISKRFDEYTLFEYLRTFFVTQRL